MSRRLTRYLLVALVWLANGGTLVGQADAPPEGRRALRASDGRMRAGRLIGSGDFVPAVNNTFTNGPEMSGPNALAHPYNLYHDGVWEVYEHRSRAVIRGLMTSDQFVPDMGSRMVPLVTVLKDGKPDRRV